MTRKETIIELVRWLPEAISGGGGGLGDWISGGFDSKHLTYGPLWYDAEPTWKELTRCLVSLRDKHPVSYNHLRWRYQGGYHTRKSIRIVRRKHDFFPIGLSENQEVRIWGPATVNKSTLDCLVYTWPDWVQPLRVEDAVTFLSDEFRGEPFLPTRVLAA